MLAAQEGRVGVARELFNRGAIAHPPNSRFLRMWGLFEKRVQEHEQARSLFRASLDCDATDVKTWMHWGLLERRLDNAEEALHLFGEVRWEGVELARWPLLALCLNPASHPQALKVSQRNYHLYYLYCETALMVKPLAACRDIFAHARAEAAWSPQLCLMEAQAEWAAGNIGRARGLFEAGAKLSRGQPQFYSPLFEAWANFEEAQRCTQVAARVTQEYHRVFNAEQEQQQRKRSEAPFVDGVSASLDSVLTTIKSGFAVHPSASKRQRQGRRPRV